MALGSECHSSQPVILGFDPGRQKCGMAVMGLDRTLLYYEVVAADRSIETVRNLRSRYPISLLVMGNQTSSKQWKQSLVDEIGSDLSIVLVDERNSSLEARDRYWQMFPPTGLQRFIPQPLRTIPRPIDDVVAILLIERYLKQLTTNA